MSKVYFNPGCALSIYKPDLENRILAFLNKNYGDVQLHKTCCHHDPQLEAGSLIIVVCSGCDRRFRNLYDGISTITLWEILDQLDSFPYPDHKGLELSIHDACPVRERPQVHQAVRSILNKMNITITETEFHGSRSICCGDDFYGKLPLDQVHQLMKKRADSMPCEEVCVYCISCIKSMYIGGRKPRYLVDLLMNETTEPQIYDTNKWHQQLQEYISKN